jgi:hypothetical protein
VLIRTRAVYSFTRTPTILEVRRALLIGVVAVAGCGGGSDGGGLSAAEYRSQANSICRQSERAARSLPQPKRLDEIDDSFQRIATESKRYERRFEALDPPPELRAKHQAAVRTSRRVDVYIEGLVVKLRHSKNQVATLSREFPRLGRLIEQGNRQSRALGLDDCVAELPTPGAKSPRSAS